MTGQDHLPGGPQPAVSPPRREDTAEPADTPPSDAEDAPAPAPSDQPPSASAGNRSLPQRYLLRTDDQGRHLTCVAAQNVSVRIERGQTVAAAAARRAEEGTIFLDGAADAEPFMDVQERIYNLDHHEGCVRAFTLATCEQAMVLVRKGLDLNAGEWTLRANEPDLDTVLAIWVLLNHGRLNDDNPQIRRAVMPLVRLEGAIDAHGLSMVELCAFPEPLLRGTERVLHELRARELELKQHGRWAQTDVLEYTAHVLHAIDRAVYSPDEVEDLWTIAEYARINITDDRTAIVCASESGIYEVEHALRKQHSERLGLIVLQKDKRTYTLRQVDAFLPLSLENVYDRLNVVDPSVSRSNRWGGSTDIGGSPRATGTSLSPSRIAAAVRWVYRGPSLWQRVGAVSLAVGAAIAIAAVAVGVSHLVGWGAGLYASLPAADVPLSYLVGRPWYAGFMLAAAAVAFGAHALRNRRLYGAQIPAGRSWPVLVPVALLAGAAGGSWLAPDWLGDGSAALAAGLPMAVAAELVFRGLVHGRLASAFRVPLGRASWRPSVPTTLAAALYAILTGIIVVMAFAPLGGFAAVWRIGCALPAALALGAACGMARERGESVVPPVILHLLAAAAGAYAGFL